MSKIAVIYWSGTGNTQAMAEAVAEGAKNAGAQADLFSVSDTSADAAAAYDKLALGCPAMGAEVLEESEFEPFFTELEGRLSGKKVALFGTAGFGGDPDYFNMLLENVKKLLPSDAVYLGGWMCQGRMPGSVRARFAAQLEQDPENANAKRMLENFDRALSHPDEADLAAAAFFSNGKLAGETAAAESL